MLTFRSGYALAAAAVFLIEVAIALYAHDRVIRPYGGDVLAVVLVYCALRAVTTLRAEPAAILATAIGFAVEAGQAYHLADALGLGRDSIARIVLGDSFAVGDLVAYALGGMAVIVTERLCRARSA